MAAIAVRGGLSSSRWREEGAGMLAVEPDIAYRRELLSGAVVFIRSASLQFSDQSIRFGQEMRKDEASELAAPTVLVGLHLDTTARKARALPATVRERVALMLDEGRRVDNRTI